MIHKHLNNYGYIEDKLPENLFKNLLKESLDFKDLKELTTGLTGDGVPDTYTIKNEENLKNLNLFLSNLVTNFENYFNYINSIQLLTDNVPLFFGKPWVNIQKKGEFIPLHNHAGLYSYTIWLKMPYDLQKETKNSKFATAFTFSYSTILGTTVDHKIFLDKNDEGKIILFPSNLQHLVYPFLKSDDIRISLSGNIFLDTRKL